MGTRDFTLLVVGGYCLLASTGLFWDFRMELRIVAWHFLGMRWLGGLAWLLFFTGRERLAPVLRWSCVAATAWSLGFLAYLECSWDSLLAVAAVSGPAWLLRRATWAENNRRYDLAWVLLVLLLAAVFSLWLYFTFSQSRCLVRCGT